MNILESQALVPGYADGMSLLNLLAEVASEQLQTDPSVQHKKIKQETSYSLQCENEGKAMSLLQVSKMSDSNLLKLFCLHQADELKRKFYFTCRIMPSSCEEVIQSFGSEEKACNEMKKHLRSHLRALLQFNHTYSSQENCFLRALVNYETAVKKKLKHESKPKVILNEKENSDNSSLSSIHLKSRKFYCQNVLSDESQTTESRVPLIHSTSNYLPTVPIHCAESISNIQALPYNNHKQSLSCESMENKMSLKRVCSTFNETTKSFTKKIKNSTDLVSSMDFYDVHSKKSNTVIHDHGYIGYIGGAKFDKINEITTKNDLLNLIKVEPKEIKEEPELHIMEETLLSKHMAIELNREIMAQDSKNASMPLPVVGCEVDFNPEEINVKLEPSSDEAMESNLDTNVNLSIKNKMQRKGKFIGQSRLERERALQLIEQTKLRHWDGSDTLACQICDPVKIFTALSTLLSHYRSHAGIRPYVCTICQSVFTRQHSLNYHMLIHSNQTRFTCDDCGKKFRHPSHFKEHRRRHTGESPYTCHDCFQKFKTRNTYKRHLKTRHKKILTTQNKVKDEFELEGDNYLKKDYEEDEDTSFSEDSPLNEDDLLDEALTFTPPNGENLDEDLTFTPPNGDNLDETFSAQEDDNDNDNNITKDCSLDSLSTISLKEGDEDYQYMAEDLNETLQSNSNHHIQGEPQMLLPNTTLTPVSQLKYQYPCNTLVDTIESLVNMELAKPSLTQRASEASPSISITPTPPSARMDDIPFSTSNDKWTNLMTEVLTLSSAVANNKGRSPVPSVSCPMKNDEAVLEIFDHQHSPSSPVKNDETVLEIFDQQHSKFKQLPSSPVKNDEAVLEIFDHEHSKLKQLSYVALNFDKINEEVSSVPTKSTSDKKHDDFTSRNNVRFSYSNTAMGNNDISADARNKNDFYLVKYIKPEFSTNICNPQMATILTPLVQNTNKDLKSVLLTSTFRPVTSTIQVKKDGNNLMVLKEAPSNKSMMTVPLNGSSIVLQNNNVIINGASAPGRKMIVYNTSSNLEERNSSSVFVNSSTSSSIQTGVKKSFASLVTARQPQVVVTLNGTNDLPVICSSNSSLHNVVSSTKQAIASNLGTSGVSISLVEKPDTPSRILNQLLSNPKINNANSNIYYASN